MSRSNSPLPASLRHMLVREPKLEHPPAIRAGRQSGSRSPHRLLTAKAEHYDHTMSTVNEPLRHDIDNHAIPARSSNSISFSNATHHSSPARSSASFSIANHKASITSQFHGAPPNVNHHPAPARAYYPQHINHADHYDITYQPRTAPLLTSRAISPRHHHHQQPDLPRRHSDQPRNSHVGPASRVILRPETSYESINHGSKPGLISRATEACELCRKTKTRCTPSVPMVEGGQPAPCRKCVQSNTECVRTGLQRKRGPLPGSTRPTIGAGNGIGEAAGDRKRKRSSAPKTTPPGPNSALPSLPPLAALSILPPPPALTRVPSTHAPKQEQQERQSNSARSSITSIHILTPEDERRNSYEFTDPPQYVTHSKPRRESQSHPHQHPHSAPLYTSLSSSWPRHPETQHQAPYQPRRPSSNHVRGDILSWPSGQPATELDMDVDIREQDQHYHYHHHHQYRSESISSTRGSQSYPYSQIQTQYGKISPPKVSSVHNLFDANYTVKPETETESESGPCRYPLPTVVRAQGSPLPSIQRLGLDALVPPPSSRFDNSPFGHTGRTLPAIKVGINDRRL